MKCTTKPNTAQIPLTSPLEKRNLKKFSYHFVGIGGIGMSAIAQVLSEQGHFVGGSDRNYDKKITPDVFAKLLALGISIYPQDGSGIHENTDSVIISSAIEEDNPDIRNARVWDKKIVKRADLLAGMFNPGYGIAIGGTNGKTTVSCMVGYILDYAGLSPTIIVGGCIKNYINNSHLGNARAGASDIISIEADESDGSIVLYTPRISVITNVSKDHDTIEEISKMFAAFSQNTSDTLIFNADCPYLKMLNFQNKNIITYGLNNNAMITAKNIVNQSFRSTFTINDLPFEIRLPGIHNISNALAAIAVARNLGISDEKTAAALSEFKGVQRRMDLIGEADGVQVIDDYAHNPEKIRAAINAAKLGCKRVIAIFQPHGYGPTNFMKKDLINVFTNVLSPYDILFIPEIFYAGGTAKKNISSSDIVKRIKEGGKNAFFIEKREDIIPAIKGLAVNGDCVLVMGARDNTLTEFCQNIFHAIRGTKKI